MVNWQDGKAYESLKNLKWKDYAWELLKRNPKYIADWKKLPSGSGKKAEVQKDVISSQLAYKWGLIKLVAPGTAFSSQDINWLIDQSNNPVELDSKNCKHYIDQESFGVAAPRALVGLGFDVRIPVDSQLKKAKELLKRYHLEQKRFGEAFAKGLKPQKHHMPKYLRILDALNLGVKNSEITEVVNFHLERPERMIAINQDIKAAQTLMKSHKTLLVLRG